MEHALLSRLVPRSDFWNWDFMRKLLLLSCFATNFDLYVCQLSIYHRYEFIPSTPQYIGDHKLALPSVKFSMNLEAQSLGGANCNTPS